MAVQIYTPSTPLAAFTAMHNAYPDSASPKPVTFVKNSETGHVAIEWLNGTIRTGKTTWCVLQRLHLTGQPREYDHAQPFVWQYKETSVPQYTRFEL